MTCSARWSGSKDVGAYMLRLKENKQSRDVTEKVMNRGKQRHVPRGRRRREWWAVGVVSRRSLVVICCCGAASRCVRPTDL